MSYIVILKSFTAIFPSIGYGLIESENYFLLWEIKISCRPMDDPSYRLIFYLDKKDEIYHYGSKEHPKISKIAKFGCEML
jgi:hypothetical protein